MLAELEVISLKSVLINLNFSRFKSNESRLSAIVISAIFDKTLFLVEKIALLQFFLKTISLVIVLIAVHDLFELVGTNVCKLLDAKHFLGV